MFCEENYSAFSNKIDKDNFRKKIIKKTIYRNTVAIHSVL